MSEDTHPGRSSRRRFVKSVVGSSALAGVGAGAVSTMDLTTQPSGEAGGPTPYAGIERMGGPAPRGLPYVPVTTDADGYLMGVWPDTDQRVRGGNVFEVAEMELGGRTYSTEWFQYCGRQDADSVRPEADRDNYLRSVASRGYDWQREALEPGQRIHLDHLQEYETWGNGIGSDGVGKPAEARWRSGGDEDTHLPVTLIRSTRVADVIEAGGAEGRWMDAASAEHVLAYLNVCTYSCCMPGYKRYTHATNFGAVDGVYCQCHQSTFDPFSVAFDTFVALPRGGHDGGE